MLIGDRRFHALTPEERAERDKREETPENLENIYERCHRRDNWRELSNTKWGRAIIDACRSLLNKEAKPTVPEVLSIVRQFYSIFLAGGCLHIVLDDGNVENSHVDFCIDYSREKNDQIAEWLALVLRRMSKTQRYKLYRIH